MRKHKKILSIIMTILYGFLLFSCGSGEHKQSGENTTSNITSDDTSTVISTSGENSQNGYLRIENKVYFGTYPQTKLDEIKDASRIDSLNALAGALPTPTSLGNWTKYDYYISSSINSFMYYIDIDYDEDGYNDYRGVYFTQYRPYNYNMASTNNNSYQDDNSYYIYGLYWFSYDPIEWDILDEINDKALIITNLAIDSQGIYPSNNSSSKFEHNGGTGYASNYALSNIRIWLNENFFNTSFNELQKSLIAETLVNNTVSSTNLTDDKYICENTNDKIFLLSYQEACSYYLTNEERLAQGTEYAKSQGLFIYVADKNYEGCVYWWLRSPGGASSTNHVLAKGNFNSINVYHTSGDGIRPACWINL